MDDLISRQAAQTELQLSARRYTVAHEAHGEGRVVWSEDLISVSDAMDVLRKIPSAEPTFDARDTQYNLPIGTDCISRQAAIDALDEQIEQCDKALSSFDISMRDEFAVKAERASLVAFRETLEYLPTAEPETNCSEFPNNSDTISREAVADAINGIECTRHTTWYEFYQKVMTAVEKLPPAQPKRGKWVDMGKDPATGKWDTRLHIYCSECGHRSDDKPTKYCPNCGAKMEAADGND